MNFKFFYTDFQLGRSRSAGYTAPKSKKPTPEGPALETPGRGYLALPPEGARIELPLSYLKKLPLF